MRLLYTIQDMCFDSLRTVRFSTALAIVGVLVFSVSISGRLFANETDPSKVNDSTEILSATALLQQFAQDWPDDRTPYRTESDTSWIAYALTMKRLVALGNAAVPALLIGCNDPQVQVRALSARVLGYLSGEGFLGNKTEEANTARAQAVVAELIGMLEEFAYRGYFTVERENAADPIAEVAMAVQFLRAI